ncbi:uncharacterized protein CANTADRAFT_33138, partial [Suhomyces tanzawaensis NRRL Y-17324]
QKPLANEAEFLRNNHTHWQHGVTTPYTTFKYYKVNNISTKTRLNKLNDKGLYTPKLVVDRVDHSAFTPHLARQGASTPPLTHKVLDKNVCRTDTGDSIFSGHFAIPRVSINIPSYNDTDEFGPDFLVPQMCYQNHFDADDLTYTFGGLCVSGSSTFEHLGLPSSVSLDKISIHFPCELPPFVSREILTNPFMSQNRNFYLFNPKRASLTYLDTLDPSNSPGHINSLISTEISDRHIFFYGGFMIKDESVTYNADIDRWIIKKKLILNKDGYILDRLSFKFIKVDLKEKVGAFKHEGRLGSAIVSNVYRKHEKPGKNPTKALLPLIFTESTSSYSNSTSPYMKPNQSPKHKPSSKVYGSSLKSVSTSSSSNSADVSSIGVSESSGSLNNSPIAGSKTSKLSILSKSSRIFHRSHHQRQLSNGTPKSPQAQPHTLKNTYSKQVKQHRSNSQHSSNDSRPVSPIQLLQKSKQEGVNRLDSLHKQETVHKLDMDLQQVLYSPPESRSTTPVSFEKIHSYKPPSFEATKQKYQETKINEIDSDSTSADEEQNRKHILFHESILKTGINGVTVFIFGGFRPVESENGVLKFVASDELLKIDLACTDDGKSIHFHAEGLMFDISESCRSMANVPDAWPSPRGYFAHSLINYSEKHEHCNNDIFQDSDIESIASRRAASPLSSSSSASFRTISSAQENKLAIQGPDQYFKGKALLVQGGCNEEGESFSGFHLFLFDTGQWKTLTTYCYDYYEYPIKPYEDDDNSRFFKGGEVDDPKLIEAELRSCHHTALYYRNEGRDYLFFMGGFRNDFLRHFDKTPYVSEKFDVTRLSRFAFVSDNTNTARIPVLNLQTQTWRFLRYYNDVDHIVTDKYIDRVNYNPLWLNARIANYGGSISLNGKSITICHGLSIPCPAKKEDYEKMRKEIPLRLFLWGAHVHFTFPDL